MTKFYAHSLEGQPPEKWQPLEEHLKNVAKKAKEFADVFGGGDWANCAGLLHDMGKGNNAFQAYLRHANKIVDEFSAFYKGKTDHSSFGAQHAHAISKKAGQLLAYALAGHHSGLMNWQQDAMHGLKYRLEKKVEEVGFVPKELILPETLPPPFKLSPERLGFQLQFFVRMIFSCLVDADFLDTEKFINPEQHKFRKNTANVNQLNDIFWKNFNLLREAATNIPVNKIREGILNQCLDSATLPSGLFSLTVPTGGGKTLSSMAFALKHALKYNKRRIIYVIPFTSIIEQNAEVFRNMFGDEFILEHHCNFTPDDLDWKHRLSTENWESPIIVTTNVQFFDSLFANRTSKCRKLHNVADSVIIFDEVQAIPVGKLLPCLENIKELSLNYGVTSVLCTATQPAINKSDDFVQGLDNVREIVSDVPELFDSLSRTEVAYVGKQSDVDLVKKIQLQKQVLCIVSTRRQAKELFQGLGNQEENFHLSALMYPVHRTRVLNEIKERLKKENACRVVSTQLIEAGVDIDFPVVFRSIAGMDSIAQAAGRCNREGLRDKGEVFIFDPESGVPAGYFRQTAQCAQQLFDRFSGALLKPQCIREYFLNYYWLSQERMDHYDIFHFCKIASRGEIPFEELAKFKMINTITEPIIIALDKEEKAVKLVDNLKYAKYPSKILKQLQKYTVQIYPYEKQYLLPYLEQPYAGVLVLRNKFLYSEDFGLITDVSQQRDPEDLIC